MKKYSTLVFLAGFTSELFSDLFLLGLPAELTHRVGSPEEWDIGLTPEALDLPWSRAEQIIRDLDNNPDLRDWRLLEEAEALGAITLSDDMEAVVGWTWTPAGRLAASHIGGAL